MWSIRLFAVPVIAGGMLFSGFASAVAQPAAVTGGETSVALDDAALSQAGLSISSTSEEVGAGALPGSVAFPINARDAGTAATTFRYDPDNFLADFSGTIEHSGTVRFTNDDLEAGDFTIGFDPARVDTLGGAASGFFVESNTGLTGPLFDLADPSTLEPEFTSLTVGGDLLASPELAQTVIDAGLTTTDVQGATVGQAQVNATAIPSPSAAVTALTLLTPLALTRRRRA